MISSVVRFRRGTTSVAAKVRMSVTIAVLGPQHLDGDVRGVGDRPGPLLHAEHQRVRGLLEAVGVGARGGPVLDHAQRLAQPGQGVRARPQLPRAQDREHHVDALLPARRLAEHVQAVADLRVLDLAEPAVEVHDEVVEALVLGLVGDAEVAVELRGLDQLPDLAADRGDLAGVHRLDRGVLVEQLLEAGQVAVRLGARHRRDEVVDERRVRAALGLRALARVVDQERVDQRQVPEDRVGRAGRRERRGLAGQPLEVAVLADVHQRVRAERGLQPAVGREVVVRGRQVGVVVDRDRVLPEPARAAASSRRRCRAGGRRR